MIQLVNKIMGLWTEVKAIREANQGYIGDTTLLRIREFLTKDKNLMEYELKIKNQHPPDNVPVPRDERDRKRRLAS